MYHSIPEERIDRGARLPFGMFSGWCLWVVLISQNKPTVENGGLTWGHPVIPEVDETTFPEGSHDFLCRLLFSL